MNPDLSDDVEIGYSSSRMLPLVALATTALLSARIAFGPGGISDCYTLVGFAGLALFGVANEIVHWNSIAHASACEYRRLRLVALKITPALERQLITTKSRQAMLNANRAMGVDGIAMSADGLTADFDTLFGACTAHHAAANRAGATRGQKGGAPSQWIAQCA
jgi:hypothetical protein